MGLLDNAKNIGMNMKEQVEAKVNASTTSETEVDTTDDILVPRIKIENAHDFCHPSDKKALETLQKVPLLKTVMKKYDQVWSSHLVKMTNLSTKLKLGPNQLPDIYNLLPPICDYFGIDVPDFYLEMNPEPNAYVMGSDIFYLTITSGLLESFTIEELKPVIAHECGHIICNHVMYHQMGLGIASIGATLGGAGELATMGLSGAYNYWSRCSEFSADRAAALYMKDHQQMVSALVRLSGGSKIFDDVNVDEYYNQAIEYENLKKSEVSSKLAHYGDTFFADHPLNPVRAYELKKWCQTDEFKQLCEKGNLKVEVVMEHIFCSECGMKNGCEAKFCTGCGNNLSVA